MTTLSATTNLSNFYYLQTSFNACVYGHGEMPSIQSRIMISTGYSSEKDMQILIRTLRTQFVSGKAIFLDIGANLGIHALYAAKLGFEVWAIEPQLQNLKKVSSDYLYN